MSDQALRLLQSFDEQFPRLSTFYPPLIDKFAALHGEINKKIPHPIGRG